MIPEYIVLGANKVEVIAKELADDEVISFKPEEEKVYYNPNFSTFSILASLLHLMIHISERVLIQSCILDNETEQTYKSDLSTVLFGILSQSGLWNGFSPEEATEAINAGNERVTK
jgi:hypothetical protein